jgi:hypothetical protein
MKTGYNGIIKCSLISTPHVPTVKFRITIMEVCSGEMHLGIILSKGEQAFGIKASC